MYKITFNLDSAICFIDLPIFDSILSYAWVKDKLGYVPHKLTLTKDEMNDFNKSVQMDNLPITKHKDGYYLASFMQYKDSVEFTGSWKKRWANKHDKLADFGKSKRVIEIDKGKLKSYDMPLNLHSIKEVWFYFDSDNVKEVERLLTTHIYSIGKKQSQGYGIIKGMKLEQIEHNPFDKVIRPIPITNLSDNEKTHLMVDGKLKFMRLQAPYWSMVDAQLCIVGL
jgi:hypothetical protein